MSVPSSPFDPAAVAGQLQAFIADYATRAGATGVVLGLSGGVDSAVCAALAARALEPGRVLGLLLPHETSHPEDEAHASAVARVLGIETKRIDITPLVDDVVAAARPLTLERVALNNAKARSRMILLYAHANQMNRLVMGTGNKSELLTGYFTKFGDGAADLYPIADVYKTHVWELARHLGLPREVVEKPPSAGLYAGQTDEQELGLTYPQLDAILQGLELSDAPAVIAQRHALPLELVQSVERRVLASEHKRQSLVVPKVGFRTPGLDWRAPRHRASATRGAQ